MMVKVTVRSSRAHYTNVSPHKPRSVDIRVCLDNMWMKQGMSSCALWLMNKTVSENVSLPIIVYMCVSLCVSVFACPGAFSLLALSHDSLTVTVFGEVLIDEKAPPRRVLSEHEGLAAGSTNPGSPNSAICPAMCSHVPAGSTQHRACLTHWLCDTAPDWDLSFNELWDGEMLLLV